MVGTMIIFSIKFLLAFSLKSKEKLKEKKKPDKPNQKKKQEPIVADAPYVIRLDKSCCTAHIEYEILPKKAKVYAIDVLCWQNAAKIYTSDGTKIFKTITRQGLTFVPICVEHFVKELSIDDLMVLRTSIIEFKVSTDKNRLGNAAKSNTTEVVYIREIDIGRTDFVDGFTVKANLSSSTRKSMQTKSDVTDDDVISRSTTYQRNEPYSRMKFEENFAEVLYKIIDYVSDISIPRDQIIFRDFIKACDPPQSIPPAVEKQPKKEAKASKAEKATELTLQMQGEIFFTDVAPIFKLENSRSDVSQIFVLPRVESLLTRLQKINLNPIVIRVLSIQNFPDQLFENTGFTDVYCKYTIPCIADCKTIEKPIDKTIWFMESHFFPTHTVPKIKLLEFLESERLVVEVYGLQRYQHVPENPKLFGEKPGDKNISKIHVGFRKNCLEAEENSKTRDVLLAYSSYDLSSLLKNVWDFKAMEQLHTTESRITSSVVPSREASPLDDDHSCDFWTHYNISMNQINLAGISFDQTCFSPLKEWILIENNTVLSLEAFSLSPQSPALILHQIPNTFKRLFIVVFNVELAQTLFGNILRHNQSITCKNLANPDILSGFVIDNGNNFVIYAEGSAVGFILKLWQDLDTIPPKDAKVFYNTDLAYEHRLYNICNKWSGFYIINLKISLEQILKNQKIYVKGNVPLLCQKALTKLNLLALSNSMKSMFQHNLFPTTEELVSLDIEYGVPYAWKTIQESISSTETNEPEAHVTR